MPIPSPNSNESRDKFISRCMISIKDDKRPQNQKVAICYTTFKNAKKRKKSKANVENSNSEPNWDDFETDMFKFIP